MPSCIVLYVANSASYTVDYCIYDIAAEPVPDDGVMMKIVLKEDIYMIVWDFYPVHPGPWDTKLNWEEFSAAYSLTEREVLDAISGHTESNRRGA